MMFWAILLAYLALRSLNRLMTDCRGKPTDHHLPRIRPEEYDGGRYDSSALRANYWRNDNGPDDERQRENNCWSGWQCDVHGFSWRNKQPPSWAYWRTLVFDANRDNSINNKEREKKGSESGHIFRILKEGHKIHQWWQCLLNSCNKSLLIKFVSKEWQKRGSENLCNDYDRR